MSFTVAVIGRPNVGKSTLFNRLTGKRLAIVDNTPGVTRDRREGAGSIADVRFRIVDTAGLDDGPGGSLEGRMRAQTDRALADADVALFLVDARAGVTPMDEHFADWLRGQKTPVIVVANKCEGGAGESGRLEAYGLGLGDPVAVSAEHGEGLDGLYEALRPFAPAETDAPLDDEPGDGDPGDDIADDDKDKPGDKPGDEAWRTRPLQLAIIGRPNVGKSTLVNRLLGEDRMLTGPEAGITRDSISVMWDWQGRAIRLIDTAGLRRKARVTEKLEGLSVGDALRAVRFAEVVVLVIDAIQGLDKQDLTIARLAADEGRALVLALNKWDAARGRDAVLAAVTDRLQTSLPQLRGALVIPCSALTGKGVDKLMAAVIDVHAVWNRRVATADLNRWLEFMVEAHPPPMVRGRRLKLRYMTQAKTRPPTFVVFASRAEALPEAYRRYLVNGIREDFGIPAVPIRIHLRRGDNPYADKSNKRTKKATRKGPRPAAKKAGKKAGKKGRK